jgi:hypothetical protein
MADESRRTYGDKDAATLLKAARVAAGFRSAAAAAVHFGWSADTLRGHESGTRSISEDDAKKYSASFGMEVRQLLKPPSHLSRKTAQNLEKLKAGEAQKVKDQRKRVSQRLRLARIVRGFPTLTSAAFYLGASRGTVNNHETGANGISERVAEAYGQAYGIEMGWLLRGTLPSGLGDEIDRALASARAGDLAVLADTLPTTPLPSSQDTSRIRILFNDATSKTVGARAGGGERLYEVDAAESDQLRQDYPVSSNRAWELPSGLLSKLIGSNAADVVVLAIPRDNPNWKLGDRLFVDRSKRDVSLGGLFAYLMEGQRELEIVKHVRGKKTFVHDPEALIGKVVASFASHRDEPPEMTEARRRLLPF